MSDRFELEDNIMSIWSSVDDLDLIIKGLEKDLAKDEILDLLKGHKRLLELKIETVYMTMKDMITSGAM